MKSRQAPEAMQGRGADTALKELQRRHPPQPAAPSQQQPRCATKTDKPGIGPSADARTAKDSQVRQR